MTSCRTGSATEILPPCSGASAPRRISVEKTPAKYLHKNSEHTYSKRPLAVLGFCSANDEVNAPQNVPTAGPLAMKAQAMRSRPPREKLEDRQKDTRADGEKEGLESTPESDEGDLEGYDLDVVDDDRWDVFILDDDGDPLPEYGDFWFPD